MELDSADWLVHGSNLILLFAYTRRDILSLRVLALLAALTIIPYYALQPRVLWPPILWSGVYAVVHTFHIVKLWLARRPVALTPEEQRLHQSSFPSLAPREFRHLMALGQWRNAPAGARFPMDVDCVIILTEGRVDVARGTEALGSLAPGQLLGIAFQLEHVSTNLELVAGTAVRVVRWPRQSIDAAVEASPTLNVAMTALVNHDLASKVIQLATDRGGVRSEQSL